MHDARSQQMQTLKSIHSSHQVGLIRQGQNGHTLSKDFKDFASQYGIPILDKTENQVNHHKANSSISQSTQNFYNEDIPKSIINENSPNSLKRKENRIMSAQYTVGNRRREFHEPFVSNDKLNMRQ